MPPLTAYVDGVQGGDVTLALERRFRPLSSVSAVTRNGETRKVPIAASRRLRPGRERFKGCLGSKGLLAEGGAVTASLTAN